MSDPQRAKLIAKLTSAFKRRSGSVAQFLEQNMGGLCELMQQGKLTARQLQWLKDFIEIHKVATIAASGDVACMSTTDSSTKSAAAATAATVFESGPSTNVSCSPKNANGKRPQSPSWLGAPPASQSTAFPNSFPGSVSSVRIVRVLEQNMGQLCESMQQGKVTAVQMQQLKNCIQTHKPATSATSGDVACTTLTESAVLRLCKRQKVADVNMMVRNWLQKSSE